MADSQFADIWQQALNQYHSDTDVALSKIENSADSPDAVLAFIDKHQKAFEAYRKQGRRVRNALEPVLCFVRSFSQVAAEGVGVVSIITEYIRMLAHFAGQPFPPAKAIFTAVSVLLMVCIYAALIENDFFTMNVDADGQECQLRL
jgi:hypothetical protein